MTQLIKNYKAHNNKLIVEPLEIKDSLKNGIIIQATRGKKDILTGMVVKATSSLDIKEGDMVWYPEYASLPITIEGNNLVVIDYEDIIISKTKGE